MKQSARERAILDRRRHTLSDLARRAARRRIDGPDLTLIGEPYNTFVNSDGSVTLTLQLLVGKAAIDEQAMIEERATDDTVVVDPEDTPC